MSFINKILNKSNNNQDLDVDEFLNTLDVSEEEMYDQANAYVKPVTLKAETELKGIAKELKDGNIILLNVSDLAKRSPIKFKEKVSKLKRFVGEIDGDIARISDDTIILTPEKIKIVKRK